MKTPQEWATKLSLHEANWIAIIRDIQVDAEAELAALRAEVERLRLDRNCEKRLRKDAEDRLHKVEAALGGRRTEEEIQRLTELAALRGTESKETK